jgi:hypothetical protein
MLDNECAVQLVEDSGRCDAICSALLPIPDLALGFVHLDVPAFAATAYFRRQLLPELQFDTNRPPAAYWLWLR